VPAGGETQDADAIRVNAPLLRVSTRHADRALDVVDHRRVMVFGPEAVLEDDAGRAAGIEPFRDGFALVVGQVPVPAAGADDDGGAVVLAVGRGIDGDRRDVVRRFCALFLTLRAGGFGIPKTQDLGLLGLRRCGLRVGRMDRGGECQTERKRHDRRRHQDPK